MGYGASNQKPTKIQTLPQQGQTRFYQSAYFVYHIRSVEAVWVRKVKTTLFRDRLALLPYQILYCYTTMYCHKYFMF